jgi:outer membrane protein TolC
LELQPLQIAKDTTASFTDTLKPFMQRYEGGVASKLDTSRAEAQPRPRRFLSTSAKSP